MSSPCMAFAKIQSANSDDNSWDSIVPTATEPSGDGVKTLSSAVTGNVMDIDTLILVPFGTNAANEVFDMRVWGWRPIGSLWIPVLLCELNCTLSATTGVSGYDVADTDYLCDTLTITYGNDGTDVAVVSPANDLVAHAIVDVKGFAKVQIIFNIDTSATANCLIAGL